MGNLIDSLRFWLDSCKLFELECEKVVYIIFLDVYISNNVNY